MVETLIRATSAHPHGAKPSARLALGGLGVAQQHRALPGGQDRCFGAVAQQLRMRAPVARTGQAASIGQAVGDGMGQHGSLLKRERPAQRGWRAVNGNRQASNLRRLPCAGEESVAAGRAGAADSAQEAEQVRLHAAATMAEDLDHPCVGAAARRAPVPRPSGLAAVPNPSPGHAAVRVALGNADEGPREGGA